MFNFKIKLVASAALTAALLIGCGGDVTSNDNNGVGNGSGSQTIDLASVVTFLQQLMASNSENSEPIEVNTLTLAEDDTVEFTPII